MSTRWMVMLGLCLVVGVGEGAAQKNCKKGKPCGNSCIAQNKTCHIGTTSAPPAAAAAPVNKAAPVAAPLATTAVADADAAPTAHAGIPAGDATWPFVSGHRLKVYYANQGSCAFVERVPTGERVYFRTKAEAEVYGLTHSLNPGC